MFGEISRSFIVDPGSTDSSVYIEDAGGCPVLPNDDSGHFVEIQEKTTANRIRETWKSDYTLSTVEIDAQLSAITITGAARGINVSAVPGFKQRGEMTYSIRNIGGTYIVRWYDGMILVAEGSRVGNGALTCAAINSSGLSVACTIAYTADLAPGIARLQLFWPKLWQVHYSTAALTFPRTPETFVYDRGIDDTEAYRWQSPQLANGAWNYALVAEGDNGITESVPTLTGTKTINAVPLPPTGLALSAIAVSNYLLWSEDFNKAEWVLNAASIATAIENPYNYGKSFLLSEDVANDIHKIGQTISLGAGQRTFSVYAKFSSEQWLCLNVKVAGVDNYALFDIQNGVLGATFSGCTRIITAIGGGWYRCEITLNPASFDSAEIVLSRADSNACLAGFVGDGVSGTYIFAAQVESAASSGLYVRSEGTVAYSATLTWNVGEAGCTFTAYASLKNAPINFGTFYYPAPVVTAADAVTATIPIGSIGSTNRQAIYDALAAAFDAAVVTANASFDSVNFPTAFPAFVNALYAALAVYGAALPLTMSDFNDAISGASGPTTGAIRNVLSTFTAGQWADSVGRPYAAFLSYLGTLLDNEPGRYALPNGALGMAAPASAALGTGSNAFGDAALPESVVEITLLDCASPLTENAVFRFVVRATKGGTQETNHDTLKTEITDAAALIGYRPNSARVSSLELLYVENLLKRSEAFEAGEWTKTSVTVTANNIANPIDGAVTADKVMETATNGFHKERQTTVLTNGILYRLSVYAKYNGRRYLDLTLNGRAAKFDIQNGVFVLSDAAPVGYGIEDAGGGWYRCYVDVLGTGAPADAVISLNSSAVLFANLYLGVITAGAYFFAAQLRNAAIEDHYIVTGAAAIQKMRLFIDGFVITSNADAVADTLNLYAVAAANPPGSTINLAAIQASAALAADILGADSAEITYDFPASGWYDIALVSSAAGVLARDYEVRTIYVSSAEPLPALNFEADVSRGRGVMIG